MNKILENTDLCTGCTACQSSCPVEAIEMVKNAKGFLYPEINQKICIDCARCKNVCPILNQKNKKSLGKTYAGYTKDSLAHKKSSSGGIFAELAKWVLEQNGCVYGAAFDHSMTLRHIRVTSLNDLDSILGSKYVQSDLGHVFADVRADLKDDQLVLFCGTSCQVAGLKSYLGHEYSNLLTADLICHGVPSPEMFQIYLSQVVSDKVTDYQFRNKDRGLKKQETLIVGETGELLRQPTQENKYYQGFLKNLYIRPSCHSCTFKGLNRVSDFTLGDYWAVREYDPEQENKYYQGFLKNLYIRPSCHSCTFKGLNRVSDFTLGDYWAVREYDPDLANDYGTSCIIVHSPKGEEILSRLQERLKIKPANLKNVTVWNDCYERSVGMNPEEPAFYELIRTVSFEEAVTQLYGETRQTRDTSKIQKLRSFISRIIHQS